MPDRSRISTSPGIFTSYIINSDNRLQGTDPQPPHTPNWQRLGLTQQNADRWHEQRDHWENVLHRQYTSGLMRTKAVTATVNTFIAAFREFANPLLNIIAVNPNATINDALAFNFKLVRQKRTWLRERIADECVPALRPLGSGRMKICCYPNNLGARASLAARADSVMFAYKIGNPMPAHLYDGTTMVVRRQAKIIYDFGPEHVGKPIYIFCCYNDTKRPELQGGWSDMRSVHLF